MTKINVIVIAGLAFAGWAIVVPFVYGVVYLTLKVVGD